MRSCLNCGSYAINPKNQSSDSDLKLCDVCHWKTKYNTAFARVKALEALIQPIAACDDGETGFIGGVGASE